MNTIKELTGVIVIIVLLPILFFSNARSEIKDEIELIISTTDDHPDVNQTFILQVTITNHRNTSITSEKDYIISVLPQTNDTNIRFKSASNSTLDPDESRTEEWEVSFNTTGVKAFRFIFENDGGDDTDFGEIYNIEVGSTDTEPGDRPEDVGFEGPTNSTTTDFITRIGGTGALAAVFGIAFVLFGYLIVSRIYSQRE